MHETHLQTLEHTRTYRVMTNKLLIHLLDLEQPKVAQRISGTLCRNGYFNPQPLFGSIKAFTLSAKASHLLGLRPPRSVARGFQSLVEGFAVGEFCSTPGTDRSRLPKDDLAELVRLDSNHGLLRRPYLSDFSHEKHSYQLVIVDAGAAAHRIAAKCCRVVSKRQQQPEFAFLFSRQLLQVLILTYHQKKVLALQDALARRRPRWPLKLRLANLPRLRSLIEQGVMT